jgi:hypothetical protein
MNILEFSDLHRNRAVAQQIAIEVGIADLNEHLQVTRARSGLFDHLFGAGDGIAGS